MLKRKARFPQDFAQLYLILCKSQKIILIISAFAENAEMVAVENYRDGAIPWGNLAILFVVPMPE